VRLKMDHAADSDRTRRVTDDLTEIPLEPDATRPDARRGKQMRPWGNSRAGILAHIKLRDARFKPPPLNDFGKGEKP